MQKIVTIGGGTGHFVLLSSLKRIPGLDLSAVVTMTDSGGSSGRLRDELGVLPPGDIRQCLVALSGSSQTLRNLLNYRFSEGDLAGHTFGNIFLSALEKSTGSFNNAVEEASDILDLSGKVIPIVLNKLDIMMELKDNTILKNEDEIQTSKNIFKVGIKDIYFSKKPEVHEKAIKVIREAEKIIISSGHLYCALAANLIIPEISQLLLNCKAEKIYITNLMNLDGQNNNWTVKNYLDTLESFVGGSFLDYVIVNTEKSEPILLEKYQKHSNELPVVVNKEELENQPYKVIYSNLLSSVVRLPSKADRSNKINRCFIRHDEDKLAKVLGKIINK